LELARLSSQGFFVVQTFWQSGSFGQTSTTLGERCSTGFTGGQVTWISIAFGMSFLSSEAKRHIVFVAASSNGFALSSNLFSMLESVQLNLYGIFLRNFSLCT